MERRARTQSLDPPTPTRRVLTGPCASRTLRSKKNKSTEFREHAQNLGEQYLVGKDLSETWQRMRSAFHDIEAKNYQYWPQGVNSNTIIDATLAGSGNDPTYRDGTAGNSEWTAPDRQGQETIWTPGLNSLPPPPGTDEEHRRPQGNGRKGRKAILPRELLELSDDDFLRETDGPLWRQIWER